MGGILTGFTAVSFFASVVGAGGVVCGFLTTGLTAPAGLFVFFVGAFFFTVGTIFLGDGFCALIGVLVACVTVAEFFTFAGRDFVAARESVLVVDASPAIKITTGKRSPIVFIISFFLLKQQFIGTVYTRK